MKSQTAFLTHKHVVLFTHMNPTSVQPCVGICKNMGTVTQTPTSESKQVSKPGSFTLRWKINGLRQEALRKKPSKQTPF